MLAECLVGHDYALIMDSMDSGSPPGTVYTVDLLAAADDLVPPRTHASHGLSFMDELSLIPKDRLPKTVLFIGIEACDNGYGDELSEHLNERLKDIAAQISEVIAGLRASSPRNA